MCGEDSNLVVASVNTDHEQVTTTVETDADTTSDQVPDSPDNGDILVKLKPTIASLAAIQEAQASDPIILMASVKEWLLTGVKPQSIQSS